MAAYQCLNCHEIECGIDDRCDKPDLFCINDMPGEILRLRALCNESATELYKAQRYGAGDWSDLIQRLQQ